MRKEIIGDERRVLRKKRKEEIKGKKRKERQLSEKG